MGIVLQWWLIFLLMGLGFLPLTTYVFRGFDDGGWMFAKTIGLFLVSWLVWTLNCTGLALFQQSTIVITLLVLAAVNYAALFIFRKMRTKRRGTSSSAFTERAVSVPTILIEEAVFLALFGLWVYIIGFKPEAYGTEKFMDYGFMTAMTRSLTMPFEDMWFAGSKVNYYYGGQYIATLLVKMTGVTTGEGYNLMRAIVASLSFSLPASLGYQLMRDKLEARCADHAGAFSQPFLTGGPALHQKSIRVMPRQPALSQRSAQASPGVRTGARSFRISRVPSRERLSPTAEMVIILFTAL